MEDRNSNCLAGLIALALFSLVLASCDREKSPEGPQSSGSTVSEDPQFGNIERTSKEQVEEKLALATARAAQGDVEAKVDLGLLLSNPQTRSADRPAETGHAGDLFLEAALEGSARGSYYAALYSINEADFGKGRIFLQRAQDLGYDPERIARTLEIASQRSGQEILLRALPESESVASGVSPFDEAEKLFVEFERASDYSAAVPLFERAVALYETAIEQGDARGHRRIAEMLKTGISEGRDSFGGAGRLTPSRQKAVIVALEKGVQGNDPEAMVDLALYRMDPAAEGFFDTELSTRLLERAAELGSARGNYYAGIMDLKNGATQRAIARLSRARSLGYSAELSDRYLALAERISGARQGEPNHVTTTPAGVAIAKTLDPNQYGIVWRNQNTIDYVQVDKGDEIFFSPEQVGRMLAFQRDGALTIEERAGDDLLVHFSNGGRVILSGYYVAAEKSE